MILIIDDHPDISQAVSRLLALSGYDSRCADCGTEGLREIASCRPALIILDYMMPDMTGLDMLRTAAQLQLLRGVRIVMYTATPSEALQLEGRNLGVSHWVCKGGEWEAVLTIVDSLLTA